MARDTASPNERLLELLRAAAAGPSDVLGPDFQKGVATLLEDPEASGASPDVRIATLLKPIAATAERPGEDAVVVSFDFFESFATDALEANGMPRTEVAVCAAVLLDADRQGISTHGLSRLKPMYIDRIDKGLVLPAGEMTILSQKMTRAPSSTAAGPGLAVGVRSMLLVI
ncbi:hypothetical protein M885DRAFT_569746 [Pelagophyceae sp. CCMP2097]|nr:hypothetical protein M885DRAFT_569746 [Pelagophyceae sp. CCMP2097]